MIHFLPRVGMRHVGPARDGGNSVRHGVRVHCEGPKARPVIARAGASIASGGPRGTRGKYLSGCRAGTATARVTSRPYRAGRCDERPTTWGSARSASPQAITSWAFSPKTRQG